MIIFPRACVLWLSIAISTSVSFLAHAQEGLTRDGDELIEQGALDTLLRGQRLVFFDDGVSHFYNDGRYTYAYDLGRGGYAYGYFEVTGQSTVCITFINGASRCDVYVENSGRLVMITADSTRFPIRDVEDAGPDPALQ